MKKLVLIYWLCIASASAFSQSVELKVNNPMPRIGDNLYLSYVINPEKTDLQKNVVNITSQGKKPSPFQLCTDPDYSIANGSLSMSKKLEKTGNLKFGPFSFIIDGKTYKSGVSNVTIYPELPKEKNGLWISYVKSGEDNYVIIEQRIEGYDQSLFSSGTPSLLNNDKVFVRVVDSLTNKPNRDIIFVRGISSFGTRYLGNDTKNKDSQFMQKTTVYKVWTSEKYKNDFKLGSEQLLNLPEKSDFSPILIKVD